MRPLCKVVKAHRDGATGSETADSDRHGKNAQISDRPCSAKAVQGHTITAAQRPDSRCIRRREAPFGGQQGQEMQHDERGNHKPCIATAARGGATFRCTSIRCWDGILQLMSLSMMLKLCRAQRDFPDLALTTYTRDGEREQGLLLWPVATVTRAQQLHSILEIQGRKALTSLGGCCSSGGRSLQ